MRLKNLIFFLDGLLLAILLIHSINRDIHLENQYPGDLRNRVVGARLQKDGKLPYFYQPAADRQAGQDVSRYIDPQRYYPLPGFPTNITSSPFFHQLLYPICDLPQRTISRAWMWFEYFLLAGIIWMACGLSRDRLKIILLVNVGILFTATEAWKSLIQNGQMYFVIAFLIGCVITGFFHKKRAGLVISAICAILLVLIRPIALVMFIPFIFQYKNNRLFITVSCLALALYGLYVLASPFQNALWKEYGRAVQMHILHHQQIGAEHGMVPLPAVLKLEGFDFTEVAKDSAEHPIQVYSENGNFFVIYSQLTKKQMPLALLNALSLFTILTLTGLFYYFFRKRHLTGAQGLLFGFILYMVVGAFSPIHMHQYYTVQWLPLVLFGFLLTRSWKSPAFILLASGLFLNIINPSWIPMRHTLGEIGWYIGLLIISFSENTNEIPWKQQS